jgi:predicted transcriptional regulator
MATANDKHWSQFFKNSNALAKIQTDGFAYITADELKAAGGREPRLMAKIDSLGNRPKAFQEHEINILPVQNGRYILFKDGQNSSFYQFETSEESRLVEEYVSNKDLQAFDSFPANRSFSESQAIDFAHIASLLAEYSHEENLQLTVRGRLYSGEFSFVLPQSKHLVEVANVQIEVDAGYETANSLLLLEAKIGRRENFNIRQLWYPWMQWSQRTAKKIRPIFFSYSNGQYLFTEFNFDTIFGSIEVVDNRVFTINESAIAYLNLQQILYDSQQSIRSQTYTIPQANDLDKVVDLIQLVSDGQNSKLKIAECFEFDERQADYYANAASYLGLLERAETGQQSEFQLTCSGKQFLGLKLRAQRTKALVEQMATDPLMREVFQSLISKNFIDTLTSSQEIASLIEKHSTLTGTTPMRRASTIKNWLRWLTTNTKFS